MKTDRELLELAAKAAGLEFKWREGDPKWGPEHVGPAAWINGCWQVWNPLTDDGDALRLVGALKIELTFSREIHPIHAHHHVTAWVGDFVRFDEFIRGSAQEAIRRAVVRAAAEIGEAMP